jgi:hypothetical protein
MKQLRVYMENQTKIIDCVEFKNELHKKLYEKSGTKNFNEYINSIYSDNRTYSKENGVHHLVLLDC